MADLVQLPRDLRDLVRSYLMPTERDMASRHRGMCLDLTFVFSLPVTSIFTLLEILRMETPRLIRSHCYYHDYHQPEDRIGID